MKKFLVTLSLLLVGSTCLVLGACNSKKVQISFDTDGGTAISSVKLDKGANYELPVPEKSGYEFEGWYNSEDLTGEAVTSVKVTGNATYYAKWAQLFTVSLDANGGTVSQTSLKLKDGSNLYDFLQDYVPVKTDYKFDCWLNGTTPVTPNYRMTESVELTARYKVKYTVEIYKESLDGASYVKDSEVLTAYDYVGTKVTPEVSADDVVGFKAVEHGDEVVSLTLTDTPANNLFKLYYDRETYTVTFRGNYPDGNNAVVKTEQVRYGNSVQLPADLQCEGYCLAGWATSASGAVEYKVDAIAEKLYGGVENKPEAFIPQKDMGLYAVWIKGKTDMFGGGDVLFLLDENSDKIYLNRGGVFFEGEYGNGEFSVRDGKNRVVGRLYPDGTFSYYNPDNDMKALTRYVYGEGLDENNTLILDGYNGITYRVTGGENNISSTGTYKIDENGLYIAEFTDGDLSGQTLTIKVMTMPVQNTNYDVFSVLNEEKYGKGTIFCGTYSDNGGLTSYTAYRAMIFTGFGNAFRYEGGENYTSFDCKIEGDVLTYSTSSGTSYKAKLMKIDGRDCYLPYEAAYDITATNAGDSLTLDGYGNAVWNKNGVKTTGTYKTGTTSFGKFTVTLYNGGSTNAIFIVDSREVGGDDTPAKVIYSYTQKPVGYTQYNIADASGVYNRVYFVLNDEFTDGDVKSAAMYAKIDNEIVKFSTGTYELKDGMYLYNVDTFEIPDGITVPFGGEVPDKAVLTVVSLPAGLGVSLPALVCVEYSVDSVPVSTVTEYTAEDGAKLSLLKVGSLENVAIHEDKNGNKTVGTYTESSNILAVTVGSASRYFELDKNNQTFEPLMYAPYRIYKLTEKLSTDRNSYIIFTGKGKIELPEASYTVVDGQTSTTVVGTVAKNDDGTYTFVSDDGNTQVQYTLFTSSSSSAFAVYNETYSGRYVSEYGTLELDGYGANAELTITDGTFSGTYSIEDENLILIATEQRYFYVDVVNGASRSFTIRGVEYGTFFIYDNAYLTGVMLEFDGYGKLKAYTLIEEEGERVKSYIDENGTYDMVGDVVTVHYDGKNIAGVFRLMVVSGTNIPLFVTIKDEVIGTYISTSDWAVLILDGAGKAVKYSGDNGTREDGFYTIVTENLLYYYNEDGDDACVYEYDTETGVATANNYMTRGYYTSTLESLVFTRFGYAVFNGTTRYYYYIEDDSVNNVTIYRRPKDGETGANAYNFIKIENFCAYGAETIEFEGKSYSLSDGFAISFNRQADNAGKYPVPFKDETEPYALETLSFTPAGSTEFIVSGTVILKGGSYSCYIIREMVDGELQTYVRLPLSISFSGNYFRFDIDITYGGANADGSSNSFYTVKSMSHVLELESYIYQYNYFMYNYFASMMGYQYGINIPNNFGTVFIKTVMDEEGVEGETYVDTDFGTGTDIYDTEGELIKPNHLDYVYDEKTQLYECEFTHTDGYVYRLKFARQSMSNPTIIGYILHSVVRVQTLTDGDYSAEVEMLIASDYFDTFGEVFQVKLKKGEDDIEFTTGLTIEDGVYYINRTTDEETGKITATQYYRLTFTKSTVDAESKAYPVYTAVSIRKLESVVTVYGENQKTYADVDAVNHKVLYFYLYNDDKKTGTSYMPYKCEYSEENGEYTVTLQNGRIFSVKVTEGGEDEEDTVVITEVELPEENEGTEND